MSRSQSNPDQTPDPALEDDASNLNGTEGPSADGGEVQKLQAELKDARERLVRTQADFQNARRRLEADKEQAVAYANSSLLKSLLPVIDNFERALSQDAGKVDAAAILKGMQIVHDQWMNVLRNQSVETMVPQVGTPYDPHTMEAVMQQPSEQYKEPTVTQVFEKGFTLHGRTLRPAKVAVSKLSD